MILDAAPALEALLQGPPVPAGWEALCALVEHLPQGPAREAALPAAVEALDAGWPDAVRIAPPRWVDAMLAGQDLPELVLARTVVVVGRALSPDELRRLAACDALAGITELRLFDVGLDDADLDVLAARARFRRLGALYCPWNRIGPDGLSSLLSVPAFAGLRLLHLYKNALGDAGARVLADAPCRPALEALNVCFNDIGPDGARAIAAAPHLGALRILHIGINRLGDEGVATIGASPHLAALREINVKVNGIGPEGVRALIGGPAWARLERVFLEDNPVTDEGVTALAEGACPINGAGGALRMLHLGGAGFGPEAVRAIARAPALAGLVALTLYDNRLGDAGVAALLDALFAPRLTALDLSGDDIGPEGGRRLDEALGAGGRLSALARLRLRENRLGPRERVALARTALARELELDL